MARSGEDGGEHSGYIKCGAFYWVSEDTIAWNEWMLREGDASDVG